MRIEPACQGPGGETIVDSSTHDKDAGSFVAVVHHGDLAAAAASIGIGKGQLKQRVHALSARMGEALLIFDDKQRVVLTQAGERCYRHLAESEASRSEPTLESGALTLAMPAILMETVFCRPLLSWLRKHRGSRITLLSEDSHEADIRLWVSQGQETDAWRGLFRARRLSTLSMVPCVGARFSSSRPHRAGEIERCRLAQYDAYAGWSGLRPWNERVSGSHAVTHVQSPEMYARAIKWLGCLGVLPERTCRHDPDLRALPLLLPEKMELDIWLGYRENALLRPEGRTLGRMITDMVRESGG